MSFDGELLLACFKEVIDEKVVMQFSVIDLRTNSLL